MLEEYGISFKPTTETNVVNILTNEFPTGTGKKTYAECIFIEKCHDDYTVSKIFKQHLQNSDFKSIVSELINFGLYRYELNYSDRYMNTNFKLYEKYTYEDVCRILEWEKGEVPLNIGGYKFDKTTKTYPVFINYDKDENISDTINYKDRFISNNELIAISKPGRTSSSDDIVQSYNAKRDGVEMSLFIRKNKDDKISKEFYFLGKIRAIGEPLDITMENTDKPYVEIMYRLNTPVRDDIYEYILS